MIGPGHLQLITSVLFVSVLARPVVDVTLKLLTSSLRGWAWLLLVVLGAVALQSTIETLRRPGGIRSRRV